MNIVKLRNRHAMGVAEDLVDQILEILINPEIEMPLVLGLGILDLVKFELFARCVPVEE